MKKSIKLKGITCLCIGFIATLLSLVVVNFVVSAETGSTYVSMNEVAFEKTYSMGDEVDIPSVKEVIDGKSIEAKISVCYPDGNAYYTNKVKINQAGQYIVNFIFVDNGTIVRNESKAFLVYDDLFSFQSKNSTASYDASLSAPGLHVDLEAGDTITFNNVVDLSGYTKNDNLFSFYFLPETNNTLQCKTFSVQLTDIYDPDNTVTILVEDMWGQVCARAGFTPGVTIGHELTAWHNVIHANEWGAIMNGVSFYTAGKPMSFSMDMNTYEVFATGTEKTTVVDLNSYTYFSDLWTGFTDNKVKISVTADGNVNKSASFVITEITGNDLQDAIVTQELSPNIEIISNKGMEYGEVGGTTVIPQAEAFFLNARTEVYTSLYYNYYDEENRANVDFQNNLFRPERAGFYTVEYKAYNNFGSPVVKLYDIMVLDSLAEASIDVNPSNALTSGYKGTLIKVADATYNIPDKVEVTTTNVTVTKAGKEIPISDGEFFAEEEGEYTVTYALKDQVGRTVESSYKVNVSVANFPVFGREPDLYDYYLGGYDYVFPVVKAYNYATNQEVSTSLRYKVSDGSYRDINQGEKISLTSQNVSDTLFIEYYVKEGGTIVSNLLIERPMYRAYSNDQLDASAYFVCDEGVLVEKNSDNYSVVATKDGATKFIKEQLANDFNISCNFDASRNGWREVVMYFTDSVDKSEKVAVRFRNNGDSFYMNVGETGEFMYDYQNVTLKYSPTNLCFSYNNVNYKITEYVSGKPFSGFSSGFITFEMEFDGVDSTSAVNVTSFNNQALNASIVADYSRPRIDIVGELGGRYAVGATVQTAQALASDIFDPTIEFYLTVKNPSGGIVTDINGVYLEKVDPSKGYFIALETEGVYIVEYTARGKYDFKDETVSGKITATAKKFESPITIDGEIQTEAKVGDTIIVPKATSYDKDGTDLQVYITVVAPDLYRYDLTSGYDSFKANRAGTYTVLYYVLNSDEVPTIIRYVIEVK